MSELWYDITKYSTIFLSAVGIILYFYFLWLVLKYLWIPLLIGIAFYLTNPKK